MNDIKVSVIVPVYNVEKYLKRCVDSLINQTLKEIEIILVDDGSKDNSSQMCDEFAKLDNRIKVIHKENNGLGMARNTGLDNANGEYVAFIDSDDFIELNAYEEMYNKVKEYDADMLISDFNYYNTKLGTYKKGNTTTKNKLYSINEVKQVMLQMIGNNPLRNGEDKYDCSVCKNIYKRSIIEKNNIRFYSERQYVSEDAIFNMMIVPLLNKIIVVNKAYYYYCNNDDISLTSTFKENKLEQSEILLEKEYELLKQYDLYNDGKIYVDSSYLGSVRAYIKFLSHSPIKLSKKKIIVRNIINNNILIDILRYYPYKSLPLKQRVFNILLQKQAINLSLLVGRLQKLKRN